MPTSGRGSGDITEMRIVRVIFLDEVLFATEQVK